MYVARAARFFVATPMPSSSLKLPYTAVSRKVVQKKRKSVRDNVEWDSIQHVVNARIEHATTVR